MIFLRPRRKVKEEKIGSMKLKRILSKKSGRDSQGKISVRHKGGRQKRLLREIDFARKKKDLAGQVKSVEYDPNRSARVALVVYPNGQSTYILAPLGLEVGMKVVAGEDAPINVGNALPLGKIPIGTQVHNLEVRPGKGGQLVRGAGTAAVIQGKQNGMVIVKLPSGEVRRFDAHSYATIGQTGRIEHKSEKLGKAGRARLMGIRPTVRGTAMHPGAHPHGGGEGRTGEGMPPKTPWGKPARGVRTRKKGKYSDKFIVERRKK